MRLKKSYARILSNVIKLDELNWKQIEGLDKEKTIFFLPISPLEEHGPHLPVGTDIFTAKDASIEAIKILNKKKPDLTCVLIPAVPLGFCKFNADFPGSISISSKVVREIIYGIGSSLARHRFKFMVISTFHMAIAHLKGIYSGMKRIMMKYDMKVCEPWGPYFFNNEVIKREPKLGFDTSKEIHAGFRETSLMKYQYPYLVDESYKKLQSIYRDLQSPSIIGKTFKQIGLKDGYVGSPARADTDYGRWFFSEIVNVYVKSSIELYEGKKQPELPKNIRFVMKALFWQ